MVRRVLTTVLLVLVPALAVPIAIAPAAPSGAAPPSSIQRCMNGGWQTLTDASGQPFANQGLCIDFAIHHPVSLADLATSSFTGTSSGPVPTAGCGFPLLEGLQTFDGSYPGSGSVGTVNLHISGCASFSSPSGFSGSFTITTSVGTLGGSASGPISGGIFGPLLYELTLSVMTGTGSFAGTSGNLQVAITWPRSSEISGSVTPL